MVHPLGATPRVAADFGLDGPSRERLETLPLFSPGQASAAFAEGTIVVNVSHECGDGVVTVTDFAVDTGPGVFVPIHTSDDLYGICAVLALDDESVSALALTLKNLSSALALAWMIGEGQMHFRRVVTPPDELSGRHRQILERMARGETNSRIAISLGFSASTIRHESMKIYRYLGVSDRRAAVEVARSRGLVSETVGGERFIDQSSKVAEPPTVSLPL